jgi:hypothetical protein
MAFKSRDGKREFSMASQKSIYDRGHGEAKPEGKILDAPDSAGEGETGENQEPEQVVAEHGLAHTVHIEHPQEGEEGMHQVHSEHPDGHKHHSTHESGEEAHEHGKKLAGMGDGGEESQMGDEDMGSEGEEEY